MNDKKYRIGTVRNKTRMAIRGVGKTTFLLEFKMENQQLN